LAIAYRPVSVAERGDYTFPPVRLPQSDRVDRCEARTNAVLTTYKGGIGVKAVGQGVTGILIDAALTAGETDDLFDRAADNYAQGFGRWLAAGP
jgi:hypothetical protein